MSACIVVSYVRGSGLLQEASHESKSIFVVWKLTFEVIVSDMG